MLWRSKSVYYVSRVFAQRHFMISCSDFENKLNILAAYLMSFIHDINHTSSTPETFLKYFFSKDNPWDATIMKLEILSFCFLSLNMSLLGKASVITKL